MRHDVKNIINMIINHMVLVIIMVFGRGNMVLPLANVRNSGIEIWRKS